MRTCTQANHQDTTTGIKSYSMSDYLVCQSLMKICTSGIDFHITRQRVTPPTANSVKHNIPEITSVRSHAVYVNSPFLIIWTIPPTMTLKIIRGETNFQQSFHLLFTCFPVLELRSFENLQDKVSHFTAQDLVKSSDILGLTSFYSPRSGVTAVRVLRPRPGARK